MARSLEDFVDSYLDFWEEHCENLWGHLLHTLDQERTPLKQKDLLES